LAARIAHESPALPRSPDRPTKMEYAGHKSATYRRIDEHSSPRKRDARHIGIF
jgi:hypothetical protein